MNKPQLSEPLLTINQFDDTVSGKSFREWCKWNDLSHAQALQDQREGYIAEVEELIEDELTPHEFVSDDPTIERIVQDEKLKHLKQLKTKLASLKGNRNERT